jgi:hypothetical protein
MPHWIIQPWQRNLSKTASGKTGAVQFNLSGWLAIMEGDPWVGSPPRLLEVRPLASPTSNFSEAADACIVKILAKRDEVTE